jgi:hypothetical protein
MRTLNIDSYGFSVLNMEILRVLGRKAGKLLLLAAKCYAALRLKH